MRTGGEERRMPLVFGDCVLDLDRRQLYRGSELVATGPQIFDLLALRRAAASEERAVEVL
jgi:hypothetical protein